MQTNDGPKPILFTDYFKVDILKFDSTGAFNLKLNIDSKLFIDPKLIRKCKEPEFLDSRNNIRAFFQKVLNFIKRSKIQEDIYWKAAKKYMSTIKEPEGLCLGYSQNGTKGNAIGPNTIIDILETAKELVELGEDDPAIFEVLGIFTEGVGCDWSSDTIASLILRNIYTYSFRILSDLGLKPDMCCEIGDEEFSLLKNPFNGEPILFVPKSILCNLPVANNKQDIGYLSRNNEEVRKELNRLIPPDTYMNNVPPKRAIRRFVMSQKQFRDLLFKEYDELEIDSYDFEADPEKINVDAEACRIVTLAIRNGEMSPVKSIADRNDVDAVVSEINNFFKNEIENKDLWKSLYDNDEYPLKEVKIQPIYRSIATYACRMFNIDLSPEVNNGRGCVDFKYSKGWDYKVLVEMKVASNQKIEGGLKKQLPSYMVAEETERAHLLILSFGGEGEMEKIKSTYDMEDEEFRNKISLTFIDCRKKQSASKL